MAIEFKADDEDWIELQQFCKRKGILKGIIRS